MKAEAAAKINLGLRILRRRNDGYHDIDTVMLRLAWYDTVRAAPSEDLSLTCSDPGLPSDEANLCIRAALGLAARVGVKPRGSLHLEKRIPTGAGLGGGSSDAAATLRLLIDLWGVELAGDDLIKLAARLGADVPFFLGPSPARATGIGDRLEAVVSDDGAALSIPYHFVVVKPTVSVSTADAYRWVSPSEEQGIDLAQTVRSLDLDRWRKELTNDFHKSVIARHPEVGHARDLLLANAAGYASMSGSGSAVFGVFEREDVAAAAKEAAVGEGLTAWSGMAVSPRGA